MTAETLGLAGLIFVVVLFCAFCLTLPFSIIVVTKIENWWEKREKKKRARRNAARRKAARRVAVRRTAAARH